MDPKMYPSSADANDFSPVVFTVNGAIKPSMKFVQLNKSTGALALTIDRPRAGQLLIISQIDAGTAGHTVTLSSGTYDGTNLKATFNAFGESLVLFGISSTRFIIVQNIQSVALASS